mmetsp:Transcript_18146/g.52376  ORF Transcript_18146/g.52376 Transcript_18146/m.52376 type:complete len:204 (-) Transcript_18146:1323-1934(-)
MENWPTRRRSVRGNCGTHRCTAAPRNEPWHHTTAGARPRRYRLKRPLTWDQTADVRSSCAATLGVGRPCRLAVQLGGTGHATHGGPRAIQSARYSDHSNGGIGVGAGSKAAGRAIAADELLQMRLEILPSSAVAWVAQEHTTRVRRRAEGHLPQTRVDLATTGEAFAFLLLLLLLLFPALLRRPGVSALMRLPDGAGWHREGC